VPYLHYHIKHKYALEIKIPGPKVRSYPVESTRMCYVNVTRLRETSKMKNKTKMKH